MKIKLKVKELNLGEAVSAALPLLGKKLEGKDSTAAKLLPVFAKLPEENLHAIFDAIPQETLDEALCVVWGDKKPKLMKKVNHLLIKKGLNLTVEDLEIGGGPSVSVTLSEIEYGALAGRFLPKIQEKIAAKGDDVGFPLSAAKNISPAFVHKTLDLFSQRAKNKFIASNVNKKRQRIFSTVEELGKKHGVHIVLEEFLIEA